jgi:hypothetical protein
LPTNDLPQGQAVYAALFAEEPGLVLEVRVHRDGLFECAPPVLLCVVLISYTASMTPTNHTNKQTTTTNTPPLAPPPKTKVAPEDAAAAASLFNQAGVACRAIGRSTADRTCTVRVGGEVAVSGGTAALRDAWEETSFALERLQVRLGGGSGGVCVVGVVCSFFTGAAKGGRA